jgi:hypothetical protein
MRRAMTDNRRRLHKNTHLWNRKRYRRLIASRIHAELRGRRYRIVAVAV